MMNFFLLLILFWAALPAGRQAFRPIKESLWLAFLAGLLLSLLTGELLGWFSFFFLLAVGLVFLYRRRFDSRHPLFLPFFVFFSSLLLSRLTAHIWFWQKSFLLAGLAFFLRFLAGRWFNDFQKQDFHLL